jgi:hypothetical protein
VKTEDLVLFSNGPGELSTWVRPVLELVTGRTDLRDRYRIVLVIHPCQFSSGTEHIVARTLGGIHTVIRPAEYLKILATGLGKKPHAFKTNGLMFSLGGDLMHPVLFRRRIGGNHLLYAYTNNVGWEKHYRKIFVRNGYVRDKFLRHGCPDDRIVVTGDLVHDSLESLQERGEARRALGLREDDSMVAFLPGSREFEVKYMLPVFLRVIDELTDRLNHVRPYFLKSPYVDGRLIERALALGGKIREMESMSGVLWTGQRAAGGGGAAGMGAKDTDVKDTDVKDTDVKDMDVPGREAACIVISNGKRVPVLEGGLDLWGEGIDFAVTLPGTNTVQLAYRGIPSLVVSPLNKPELIPIEGAFGLLKWVPVIGKPVLRKAVLRHVKQYPYAALPNIYENEQIFPELFGVIRTRDITETVGRVLSEDGGGAIRAKLARFRPERSPVSIIADQVWGEARGRISE